MRKVRRVAKLVLLSSVGLVVVAVGGLLALRSYMQHAAARTIVIQTANGIDEAGYVRIGGIEQWLQIRGQDRHNPVILCLNGGPGGSWVPLTLWFVNWERDFTVVQWDQRGEGKTLETTGPSIAATMSIGRMSQDGIEVADFLRRHLQKNRIVLLGHSWGSILAVHMVKERPELFSAYVGTGQVGDLPRSLQLTYRATLEKARLAHDAATVESLEKIGPPPYEAARIRGVSILFSSLAAYAPPSDQQALAELPKVMLTAPGYSLRDYYYLLEGFASVPTPKLYEEMLATDLWRLGPEFQVPVFFFQGAEDNVTRAAQAEEYFESIRAPHKEFVRFEGGGHFTVWSMRDRFLRGLVTRVRPLAVQQ
jgi:pimeloyl-ACP methyl ester carboxylesterase